jgi:hypothetical protein
MDLYTILVEFLFEGPMLASAALCALIFIYLMWCRVGIFTNIMILGLFLFSFFYITGNLLIVGIIMIYMWYNAFTEFKKELAEA